MPTTLPNSPDPGRPYIVIMSAVTLDGKLTVGRGVTSGSLGAFVTHEVVEFLHDMRASVDAVMVGGNTIVIDNPSLTVRAVDGRSPVRVIVDPEGTVPLESKVFHDKQAQTIVAVASETAAERRAALRDLGVKIVVAGDGKFVNVEVLVRALAREGIRSLLIEGGATLNWLTISSGLVDELQIIKLPIVIGDRGSPGFAETPGDVEAAPAKLECTRTERLGNCMVLYCRRTE